LYLTIQEIQSSARWLVNLYVNLKMLSNRLSPPFMELSREDQLNTLLLCNLRPCNRAFISALVVMSVAGLVDGVDLNPMTAFHNVDAINESTLRGLCRHLHCLCVVDRFDMPRMFSLSNSFRRICFDRNGNLNLNWSLQCNCGLCVSGAPYTYVNNFASPSMYNESESNDDGRYNSYLKILNEELNT
jgi:hypothetical protein